jgi:hypothetical protein
LLPLDQEAASGGSGPYSPMACGPPRQSSVPSLIPNSFFRAISASAPITEHKINASNIPEPPSGDEPKTRSTKSMVLVYIELGGWNTT